MSRTMFPLNITFSTSTIKLTLILGIINTEQMLESNDMHHSPFIYYLRYAVSEGFNAYAQAFVANTISNTFWKHI